MKRRRHTPEQIIRKLRAAERLVGEGKTILEAAKELEISEQTFHPDAAGEVARQIDTHASETAFIEPGSPWQNAYVESFNGRVRDELLDIEEFSCLADARVVIVPAASAHHPALNTRPGVTRSRPMAPTPDAARAPRRVRAAGPQRGRIPERHAPGLRNARTVPQPRHASEPPANARPTPSPTPNEPAQKTSSKQSYPGHAQPSSPMNMNSRPKFPA